MVFSRRRDEATGYRPTPLSIPQKGQYWAYVIESENDRCYVLVEDVPFVINSADSGFSHDGGKPCILISLSDGSMEELNLDIPLWQGDDNVMYCKVKKGEYAARFSRPAYYQLCGYVEHDSARGTYMVTVNNSSYPWPLPINHKWRFQC